jgi:magnesium transporter
MRRQTRAMLRILSKGGAAAVSPDDPSALWFDLESPDAAEEDQVEGILSINVPTPAERAAVEESARFYEEDGELYLTATLLGRRDEGPFVSGPVTFILVNGKLVTVRQIRPRAFDVGQGRASARIGSAKTGADILLALLEGAAERLADLLSEAQQHSHTAAMTVFESDPAPDLRESLRTLGRIGTMIALSADSLSSLQRLLAFTHSVCKRHGIDEGKVHALVRDVDELERLAETLLNRVSYLQDAALGLIGSTQSDTLKALSLATITFVPPTLIASIFGMNFVGMTWFHEPWGPWVGFVLMILAPLALLWIARWRGWF